MITAMLFCAALQVITFLPFYRVWQQDLKKYGSDLGAPLQNRFGVWVIMFPVWALPISVMIGEIL